MSSFFSNLQSSLSKYVDPSLLDQANLESVLTDDRLKTLEGEGDAQSLDEAELLEILTTLGKELETTEDTDKKGVLSQIIASIEKSLNAGDVEQIQIDTFNENEVDEEVKSFLENQESFDEILKDFVGFPLEMQKQLLEYCFMKNDFEKINQLLVKMPTDEAHDLIVHIASYGN